MLVIIVTFVLNILIIMKLIEFTEHFSNEESCEQYLKEVREKQGVVCTKCGGTAHYWNKASKSWICKHCHHQTTLTSGTVMHGSNLPLRYWFIAIHLLTATKKTISAKEMQRQLGHKRYQPIWEMMHKLRSVMGLRDAKYKLSGEFELDEGYFSINSNLSEEEKIKRGIGSQNKAKVLVMVESQDIEALKYAKQYGYHVILWVDNLYYWREPHTHNDSVSICRTISNKINKLHPDAISSEFTAYPMICDSFPEENIHFWDTPKDFTKENIEHTKMLCREKNVKVVLVDYPQPIDY